MTAGAEHLVPGTKYEETPEEYEGPIEFVNWGGFKLAVYGASRLTTEFFDEISARRNSNKAVIIIITGPAGEGKSWLGLRFCEIFDKQFNMLDDDDPRALNPGTDSSQVPFEREAFLYLVGNNSPLKYGQCILPDEAQYAMGARRWYEDIQKDMMEQVESVRSRGFIIIIVALHLELLDKVVRKYVLTYMFHLEGRGKATVYRLYTPRFEKEMRKRRLGQLLFQVPSYENCTNTDCLRCPYLYRKGGDSRKGEDSTKGEGLKCMTLRARYERRKRQFVGKRGSDAQARAHAKDLKYRVISDEEVAKAIHENRAKLIIGDRKRIDPTSIQLVAEDVLGYPIGVQKAYKIRARLEQRYPELYKPK
jgi:hypothetical protein